MHVPEWAGGAITRELEFCRAMALGDVACSVDAGKEQWRAFQTGSLQRGQTMGYLFDAGAEAGRKQFEIVTEIFRRIKERFVGQNLCASKVVS